MSQYLLLERIQIQNANCIAGFTWGFPSITHFLGFTHKLHRQLSELYEISLDGCAVICHDHQVHKYQAMSGRDIEFIQSKNPPYLPEHKLAEDAPIIEEGRMNATVSLIILLEREFHGDSNHRSSCLERVKTCCAKGKLAGGTILSVKAVELFSARTDEEEEEIFRKVKRRLMPGFALIDRSETLAKYYKTLKQENNDAQLLDAWLNFSALKYKAKPLADTKNDTVNAKTDAEWELVDKPVSTGWLVPIMSGYKAISPLYPPGEVANVRDSEVPARFVEAVHSIGEWRSVHRITDLDPLIWSYQADNDWYLCKQKAQTSSEPDNQLQEEIQKISFETALATL